MNPDEIKIAANPVQNQKEPDEEKYTFGNVSKGDVKNMVKAHHDFAKLHKHDESKYVRCVWFPKDQIEYIFDRLKKEHASGLRVYFGRYVDSTETVVFVSTGKDREDYFTEEIQIPFAPLNRGEQCQPTCEGVEFINE